MTWQITWSAPAAHDVRYIDRTTAQRIHAALRRLADTGHGDVKRLQGYDALWRLRVGDWRVRFVFEYATETIRVVRVLPRGSAYRD